MKPLPIHCPSCGQNLAVKRLSCPNCATEVEGLYDLPLLARLSRTDQAFIVQFVKASGSLKQMASLMKVSYPTVRNRLDEIIETLAQTEEPQEHADD